ncbi:MULTISPECIES: cytochrome b/b6 domain-containing protein [unclassified Knoellia]|uniref:cytochrome b/b6 domain-containing protein n=1 Tax=Knoellia altitudinis TaxID=3404795 RepID=UPI00360CEA58
MHWRNGPHGYGFVTKSLHWLTVVVLAAQFFVGWTMEADESAFAVDEARLEQLEEQAKDLDGDARDTARDEVDRLEDELDARADEAEDEFVRDALSRPTEPSLPLAHVGLGLLILALGVVRVLWRRTGLPPWAEHLGPLARRVAGLTEKALLASLFLVPASGLLLLFAGADWVGLHVAAHIAFFAALVAHIGLHLAHARHGQLRRML